MAFPLAGCLAQDSESIPSSEIEDEISMTRHQCDETQHLLCVLQIEWSFRKTTSGSEIH